MSVAILCARHIRRLHPLTVKAVTDALLTTPEVVVRAEHQGDVEIQKLLLDLNYSKVVVYQNRSKRLLSQKWRQVNWQGSSDALLTQSVDEGILIWDGRSPLIVLDVLRLLSSGKTARLIIDGSGEVEVLAGVQGWAYLTAGLVDGSGEMDRENARSSHSAMFPESVRQRSKRRQKEVFDQEANGQLRAGEAGAFSGSLLALAKAQGTARVAASSGLARSSLYRALQSDGRLEFNTVVKVLRALGYALEVKKIAEG